MTTNQETEGCVPQLEALCRQYGIDDWHARNSLRKPIYQRLTQSIISRIASPTSRIVEIGCGIGDILLLLSDAGFRNITGIDEDQNVFNVARQRILSTGKDFVHLLNQQYPCKLHETPDFLLLINCIYFDQIESLDAFSIELKRWMEFNGKPKAFLVELIDSSYTSLEHTRLKGQSTEFNVFCRVSKEHVKSFFPGYSIFQIPSSEPYRVPKTIYLISKQNFSEQVRDLMDPV